MVMLSYRIIYDHIGFKGRIPILTGIFYSFRRFQSHAFQNTYQFFHKTSLTKCNSDVVICSHVRIQMAISLNQLMVSIHPLTSSKHSQCAKPTKWVDNYTHQIENTKSFIGPPCLPKNCQEFGVNKPTKTIKFSKFSPKTYKLEF